MCIASFHSMCLEIAAGYVCSATVLVSGSYAGGMTVLLSVAGFGIIVGVAMLIWK
jgi:hypothetical protein